MHPLIINWKKKGNEGGPVLQLLMRYLLALRASSGVMSSLEW